MPADSVSIWSERHPEIGHLIIKRTDVIIERWAERSLLEQPNAKHVHRATLLDHFPILLRELGAALAESRDRDILETTEAAREHGVQRWDNGWSLNELIRDYQILRFVVLEELESSLGRPVASRESMAVALGFDEAIADSLTAYVTHKEEIVRQLERERTAKDEQLFKQTNDALVAADRLKDQFLAILAHELRNPLAPIKNAIHILRLLQIDNSDFAWARDVIDRQATQMTRMVDDLLDISRITHGKITLKRETVDIAKIIAAAVEPARPQIENRRQKLSVVLPSSPLWASVDPSRITQVLTNLLNNASTYNDDGGSISITAEHVGKEIVIKVRDNGLGMDSDDLSGIFGLFRQVENSEHRSRGGLGIGLALVKRLTEIHGGRVEAFSEGPRTGSEFTVALPAAGQDDLKHEIEANSGDEPGDEQSPQAIKILIVDDNVDTAIGLAKLLSISGHQVLTAHDGRSAIEIAKAELPDAILLDIGLPIFDGYQVATALRSDPAFADLMLIAISGYGQEQDRNRSLDAGFDHHLVKPVDFDQLYRIISDLKQA